jgi:undecaprenyl-diphosphatase
MTWFAVFLLAIVEGFTEFLPVSSTGHMILAGSLWHLPQGEFLKSFEIIVQLGAILAVLSKYWKTLLDRRDYWPKIIAAFIPTMVLGLLFYKIIKTYFLGNVTLTLVGLFVGGVALIFIERAFNNRNDENRNIEELTLKQAAIIGVIQSLSMVPGVSRSASTIVGGMLFGLSRKAAVEFSFLLAMPVMAAATTLDILQSGFSYSSTELMQLGVGLLIAFIVARLSVDWLVSFVEKHSLSVFGWYRVVLVIVYLLFTSL